MSQTLASFYTRFLHDPVKLREALTAPLILFEPLEKVDPDTENPYRYKTVSGVSGSTLEPGEPLVFPLEKNKDNAFARGVTVGRTSNNDVVIDDGSVSRFHAWFQQDEATSEWSVVDAGSKNGTAVNGQRLTPKKPAALEKLAKIKFGQIEVTYYPPEDFLRLLQSRSEH